MGFNRPSKIQENALPMMLAEPYVHVPAVPCQQRKELKGLMCRGMGGWGRAPQPQYFWCDSCLGFFLCLELLLVNPGRNKAAREHGSSSLGWGGGVVEVLHRLLGRLSLRCKVGSTETPGGDVHNAKVLPENSSFPPKSP